MAQSKNIQLQRTTRSAIGDLQSLSFQQFEALTTCCPLFVFQFLANSLTIAELDLQTDRIKRKIPL